MLHDASLRGLESHGLEARVVRFAEVEVRLQRVAFRNAVFRACNGTCMVSGCSVPEALEVAHLEGCDWRAGHNGVGDGVLLRRDLHTLYDRRLMTIAPDGEVGFDDRVREYYAEWDRVRVRASPSAMN